MAGASGVRCGCIGVLETAHRRRVVGATRCGAGSHPNVMAPQGALSCTSAMPATCVTPSASKWMGSCVAEVSPLRSCRVLLQNRDMPKRIRLHPNLTARVRHERHRHTHTPSRAVACCCLQLLWLLAISGTRRRRLHPPACRLPVACLSPACRLPLSLLPLRTAQRPAPDVLGIFIR
jgi:hypothetical protein